MEKALDLYFVFLEKVISKLSLNRAYFFIHTTAHIWRPAIYTPLIQTASFYINKLLGCTPDAIIRELLHFEARMVLENGLIMQSMSNKILNSFQNFPIKKIPTPALIVGGHFFNFWLLIEALNLTENAAIFVPYREPTNKYPYDRSVQRLWKSWPAINEFILVCKGKAYQRIQKTLENGKRVFLLIDTPRPSGYEVNLLGQRIYVSARALQLALDLDIPVFFLGTSATNCLQRYQLYCKSITGSSFKELLGKVFLEIEMLIQRSPASWSVWPFFPGYFN